MGMHTRATGVTTILRTDDLKIEIIKIKLSIQQNSNRSKYFLLHEKKKKNNNKKKKKKKKKKQENFIINLLAYTCNLKSGGK